MTKARTRRPADPDAIARLSRERRHHAEDVARLAAQPDIQISKAAGAPHHRLDVFDLLKGRAALSGHAYEAARRLERDIAAWLGVDRDTAARGGGGEVSLTSDRRLIAGDRVTAATGRIGARDGTLLSALIQPQFDGQAQRWREIVQRITAETNEHAQTAVVRSACENLAQAYVAIDYAATSRARQIIAGGRSLATMTMDTKCS